MILDQLLEKIDEVEIVKKIRSRAKILTIIHHLFGH